jgi:Trypsin-like peptidase domain
VDITSTRETVATKTLPIIVAVGADGGRGFVVEAGSDRYVITAAHCLPELPPASTAAMIDERTFANLLGPLDGERTVWAECAFVDPVADIAVLCSPDGQSLFEEADAYEALVENEELTAWTVAAPPPVKPPADWPTRVPVDRAIGKSRARLISLDGRLFDCTIVHRGGGTMLWVEGAAEPIMGGMSGTPIVDNHGRAIGMVCTGNGIITDDGRTIGKVNEGGPNPKLVDVLPAWLVRWLLNEKPGLADQAAQ